MPLVPSKTLVSKAQKGGYAVPAFNTENLEMTQGIIAAAEAASSPVILQTTPSTANYIGLDVAAAMVRALAERASVPVALHLDHGDSFELAVRAARAGYTSIMFDGSHAPLPENIAGTALVKRLTAPIGLTLEGEVGGIGGKEDGHGADLGYTNPAQAVEFVEKTGVDMLAIAIGTAHGFYREEPRLDFALLRKIRNVVPVPLVLHGSSGLPDAVVREAIEGGMCKVNFATELRATFTGVARATLADAGVYDPKKFLGKARDALKAACLHKIEVCGSGGTAFD